MASLHVLANPARFRRFSQRVLPALSLVTALALAVGLWLALIESPPDYQQGETVRIMFIHVPSAWLSMMGYGLLDRVWGQLMVWRTDWVWAARLTSMLLLFFLYLGHIALSRAYDDAERGDRAAAILALVGVINLPIIKFSVAWWNTLHQPASIMKLDGPSIDPSLLWPLLWMMATFALLFVLL